MSPNVLKAIAAGIAAATVAVVKVLKPDLELDPAVIAPLVLGFLGVFFTGVNHPQPAKKEKAAP